MWEKLAVVMLIDWASEWNKRLRAWFPRWMLLVRVVLIQGASLLAMLIGMVQL